MRVLFAIAALFGIVFSGEVPQTIPLQLDEDGNMKYFLVETSPGVYEAEDLVDAEINARVSARDIVYHFFTQRNPNAGIDVTTSNFEALSRNGFSVSKDSVFVVHGWRGDNISSFNNHVREAILAKYDVNLFMVDWSPIADRNYISAKIAVVGVGQQVAVFLRALQQRYNFQLSRTLFIGFSLGAHVAGSTGADLNGQVDRIVGLDPAGPLYSVNNINDRLDPTDARFVQVIHTNGGLLGFSHPSGHSDYYPNGGSSQPGCGIDLAGGCSHGRAYQFFYEAVLANVNNFVGARCSTFMDFTRGNCRGNPTSRMGGYQLDQGANGEYFLETNNNSPFARG